MASAGRLSPAIVRCLSTRSTTSSLRDPNPNWSNRPPKETILLDGCDFEHWLVVMEAPQGDITRDEIINSYIKTLATVVGSEEEARMKIYSVSTRCYYAFGALVSEEVSLKIKELPGVRWVLPWMLRTKIMKSCLESVGYNQMPLNNPGGVPPNNMAPPSNAGWNDPGQYQNNYTQDRDVGVNPGPNRY